MFFKHPLVMPTMSKSNHLLSDHMPVLTTNSLRKLVTYNMTYKAQDKGSFYNNGWGANENQEEYENRLAHIATKIVQLVDLEKPDFICLQECPKDRETHKLFIQRIKSHSSTAGYAFLQSKVKDAFLIIIYNKRRYALEEVPALSTMTFNAGLKNRALLACFTNVETQESHLVGCIHANFHKEVRSDIELIYSKAKQLKIHHIDLLGDYNRDLLSHSDDYSLKDISDAITSNGQIGGLRMFANAVAGASFCYGTQEAPYPLEQIQTIETRDGIISSEEFQVQCILQMNYADKTLLKSMPLNKKLACIPEGFLENLRSVGIPNVCVGDLTLARDDSSRDEPKFTY